MAKLIGTFRDLPHKLHLAGGGKAKASDKQLKQYKEFFDLGELCKIGFPDNATTIAHDPHLNLLAIGTKTGEILVLGASGHEFTGCHKEACEVKQLLFLPEEGRLVTLTSDNRLHKWELNACTADSAANWRLEHSGDLLAGPADGADGQTAACVALVGGDRLWVGYASGSVRLVNAKEWKFTEAATSGDSIAKGLTEEASSQVHGWGSVVAMEASPTSGKQVAVGFSSGTVAVLNSADCGLHSLAPGAGELRCLNWQTDGAALYTGHADGSYAVWRADQPAEASRLLKTADNPQTVYGPFPCLPVTKLVHRTAKLGAFTVLAGGMAKNTHADRHTVTLIREQEHVCLDLCSPVVDVALLCSPGDGNTGQAGYDEPHTLLVLCESQLVALDLYGAQWPEYRLPYLTAITATGAPVTAARIYGSTTAVAEQLRAALLAAAAAPASGAFTSRAWPITGGKSLHSQQEEPAAPAEGTVAPAAAAASGEAGGSQVKAPEWDLLVTGHGDGSVAFWKIGSANGGTSAALLHSLDTADLFSDAGTPGGVCGDADLPDAGGFPPFRAVGRRWRRTAGDSEASRFAVTGIEVAGDSVLVGGAAGQATLWRLAAADAAGPVEVDVRTVNADIVSPGKDSHWAWEGQAPLRVREDPWHPAAASAGRRLFEPATVVLAFPPDRVCSLALNVGHGLAAIGTGFGLALIDTGANRCLAAHCTLPPPPAASATGSVSASPAAASGAAGASATTPAKGAGGASGSGGGGSSITKSLRQSFRRLKKLRGGKKQEYTVTAEEGAAAAAAAGPSTSAEHNADATATAPSEEAAAASPTKKDKKKKEKKEKKHKKEKKEDKKEEKAEAKKEEKMEEMAAEEKKKEEKPEPEKKTEDVEAKPDEPCSSSKAAAAAEAEEEGAAAAAEKPQPQKQSLTSDVGAESPGRVRCLLIADSHLISAGASTPALFAGDRAGRVYAFQVEMMPPAAAGEVAKLKQARLAKELHLRHGAPVVAMHVTGEQQQLVVASEQQVKLFSLPSLRPRCKARLLPAEAPARLRACGLAQFRGGHHSQQPLHGLTVEDSLGCLLVLGLPQLKILAQLDRADPAAAAAGVTFQPAGAADPLAVAVAGRSRVRLVRLSPPAQAAGRYAAPAGLDLPEWARPAKIAQPAAAASPAAAAVATTAVAGGGAESASAEMSPAAAEAAAAAEADLESEAADAEHDADRSHHHVAADITMDDIKEYAAAAPLPPTDTIPESTDEKLECAPPAAAVTADAAGSAKEEAAAAVVAPAAISTAAPGETAQEKPKHHQPEEPPAPVVVEVSPAEVKAASAGSEDQPATACGAGDIPAEQ